MQYEFNIEDNTFFLNCDNFQIYIKYPINFITLNLIYTSRELFVI